MSAVGRLTSPEYPGDFADALGVSFSTINRWENGRHVPNKITVNAIEAFCIANGVSFAYTEALEE